jgi:hypothetical protein
MPRRSARMALERGRRSCNSNSAERSLPTRSPPGGAEDTFGLKVLWDRRSKKDRHNYGTPSPEIRGAAGIEDDSLGPLNENAPRSGAFSNRRLPPRFLHLYRPCKTVQIPTSKQGKRDGSHWRSRATLESKSFSRAITRRPHPVLRDGVVASWRLPARLSHSYRLCLPECLTTSK